MVGPKFLRSVIVNSCSVLIKFENNIIFFGSALKVCVDGGGGWVGGVNQL